MIDHAEFDVLLGEVKALARACRDLTALTASLVGAIKAVTEGALKSHEEHEERFRKLENTVQVLAAGLAASRRS